MKRRLLKAKKKSEPVPAAAEPHPVREAPEPEPESDGVETYLPERGEVFFEADTVVYAAGMRPRKEEALRLYDTAPVFHMVGDCLRSATILNATGTAYTAARYLGRY